MTFVVDASVIVKWMLGKPHEEADTAKATALLEHVVNDMSGIIQPVHWLVEVAAILARLSPATAVADVNLLQAMEFPIADDPAVLDRATQLAIDTGQHVFDTLYHAVALETEGAFLVTADDRYRQRAERHGQILALSDWQDSV